MCLGPREDTEFLAERFEPFRGQHAANGAGAGVYMGPVELQLRLAAAAAGRLGAAAEGPETGVSRGPAGLQLALAAAALGRLGAAAADLQTAALICDANGARGYAVQARVELVAVLIRRPAHGAPYLE